MLARSTSDSNLNFDPKIDLTLHYAGNKGKEGRINLIEWLNRREGL